MYYATSKHSKIEVSKIIIVDSICGRTWNSMVSMTIAGNTYFTREKWERNTTRRHWCNINHFNMFSQVERGL